MSQTGNLMHNLDQNSTKILNLTVLERMDPYIEEILITAAHVTFYEFNVDLNQWVTSCKHGNPWSAVFFIFLIFFVFCLF
ncbi:putative mRNA-decapping enzyme subunit 1, PH-like domain superfamily [Helianthus anomalus]